MFYKQVCVQYNDFNKAINVNIENKSTGITLCWSKNVVHEYFQCIQTDSSNLWISHYICQISIVNKILYFIIHTNGMRELYINLLVKFVSTNFSLKFLKVQIKNWIHRTDPS